MKALAILGSARKDSNTLKALKQLSPVATYDLVDLLDYRISPYCYDSNATANDDFLLLARKMSEADIILFATPVYWYAMSGSMKDFFDRLTDLITSNKPIGRALKELNVTSLPTEPIRNYPTALKYLFDELVNILTWSSFAASTWSLTTNSSQRFLTTERCTHATCRVPWRTPVQSNF